MLFKPLQEALRKKAEGSLEFYTGVRNGQMHYQIRIDLPEHLNSILRPRAVLGAYGRVPHGENELIEYARVCEALSEKFMEWAKYLREQEAVRES